VAKLETLFSLKQRSALSRSEPTPLYHQLYTIIKSAIIDGTFADGTKLPTELQLTEAFNISRITSRRAMSELFREGLVERQPGKGSFVTFRAKKPIHAPMVGMLQEIESIGRITTAQVLDCDRLQPPAEVRQRLGMSNGDTALYLARVRSVDQAPFGYYVSWTLGLDIPKVLDVFVNTPRMTYFRSLGLKVSFTRQFVSATAADHKQAQILDMAPGAPLLSLTRLTYDGEPRVENAVDFLRVLYHPKRFEYHIDYDLDSSLSTSPA
jgi:GntR family transcriptional regulator